MEEKILTLKEAKEQGYTHFFYKKDGFQPMMELSILEDSEGLHYIKQNSEMELASKERYHPSGIDGKRIAGIIADDIEENHASESGDDTSAVWEAINAIDFSDVEKRIEDALQKLEYFKGSGIKLIIEQ